MAMIVDLGPLPYRMAFDMIEWCFENNIDRDKCIELLEATTIVPVPEIDWNVDIPDQYVTMFILKWS
jgi:hypothetical protein